jgi:hypothetical protein
VSEFPPMANTAMGFMDTGSWGRMEYAPVAVPYLALLVTE